jgi:hypothetical protein
MDRQPDGNLLLFRRSVGFLFCPNGFFYPNYHLAGGKRWYYLDNIEIVPLN